MKTIIKARTPMALWITVTLLLAAISSTATAALNLVSQPDSSLPASASGGGDSGLPIISADGHFVLFASAAGNLASVSNTVPTSSPLPRPLNVFRMCTCTTAPTA
jgi:hypothetical protein